MMKAANAGANIVLGLKYDSGTALSESQVALCAYGTAAIIEPEEQSDPYAKLRGGIPQGWGVPKAENLNPNSQPWGGWEEKPSSKDKTTTNNQDLLHRLVLGLAGAKLEPEQAKVGAKKPGNPWQNQWGAGSGYKSTPRAGFQQGWPIPQDQPAPPPGNEWKSYMAQAAPKENSGATKAATPKLDVSTPKGTPKLKANQSEAQLQGDLFTMGSPLVKSQPSSKGTIRLGATTKKSELDELEQQNREAEIPEYGYGDDWGYAHDGYGDAAWGGTQGTYDPLQYQQFNNQPQQPGGW
ncbi:hypothetical protein T439DRAFT_183357 [Meredithblackwellia eburnea MCA 4105]